MQPFLRALSSPNGHQRRCCNWKLRLTSCQVAATGTIAPGDPACSLREQLGENTQSTATYRHRDRHTHTRTHIYKHTHMLTHRQTVTGTRRHFENKTWYCKRPILTMWTTGWKLWPGHWKIFTLFSALFEEARENWQCSYVNQNAIFPIQKNLNCKNWVIARQCGQLTRFLWTLEVSKRYVSFSIVVQHNRFRIISLLFPSMVS